MIPFSSDIKFNLIIRNIGQFDYSNYPSKVVFNDEYCIYMKGAPERIIGRCAKILMDGEKVEPIDQKIL